MPGTVKADPHSARKGGHRVWQAGAVLRRFSRRRDGPLQPGRHGAPASPPERASRMAPASVCSVVAPTASWPKSPLTSRQRNAVLSPCRNPQRIATIKGMSMSTARVELRPWAGTWAGTGLRPRGRKRHHCQAHLRLRPLRLRQGGGFLSLSAFPPSVSERADAGGR